MKSTINRTIPVALATLFLISCSTAVKKVPLEAEETTTTISTEAQGDTPEGLIAQGKTVDAAMLYLKNASRVEQSLRPVYQLKATQLLLNNNLTEMASNVINSIDLDSLNNTQKAQITYLQLQIALQARQAKDSLQLFTSLKSLNYREFATEADVINLGIKTHELLNDNKQATLYRIQLEPFLVEDKDIIANQIAIVRVMLGMGMEELGTLSQSENNQSLKSWADLVLLVKKSKNPFRLASLLTSWKSLHPQHPIKDEVIATLAPKSEDQPPALDNIALLLPLSGTYEKAGGAVRDGFLANYYSQDISTSKPNIRIYDTDSGKNLIEIYQQAVNEGANIIVGPLQKESVEQLAIHGNHEIPMLALNQLEQNNFYHSNFYQFSLSPEAEARQIAQRAWFDGHNRAAIIFPDNKWGERLAEAFREEWIKLGGHVSAESSYDARKNDFSNSIKSLLAIDQSEQRRKDISRILQTKLRFEPRRRRDIDMIFMASLPRQARLIPPQLEFYHAEDLPIYTTSHSFTGRVSSKDDRDLNGVVIADMPWTLSSAHMESLKKQIYRTWPNESKQFNRFYAMGSDAYSILYYLNWLRGNSNARLQGATGELFMNEQNQIMRVLSWGRFKNGIPVLMTTANIPASE